MYRQLIHSCEKVMHIYGLFTKFIFRSRMWKELNLNPIVYANTLHIEIVVGETFRLLSEQANFILATWVFLLHNLLGIITMK